MKDVKNNILITIIITVVIGTLGFLGGMQYQKLQARNSFENRFGQRGTMNGQSSRNGGRSFGEATTGEIVSQDTNSITVKLQNGSTKIVILSNNTIISKTDTASKSALKTGGKIAAFGITNSDGSITAQNIQLNPIR